MSSYSAQYSDGRTAAAHPVSVRITRESLTESLHIADSHGQTLESWPLDDVEAPHGVPRHFDREPLILRRASSAGRLTLSEPRMSEALAHELAPWLKAKKKRHAAFWVKATMGIWACALVLWFGLPAFSRQIAPLIPQTWELTLGEQTQRQLESMLARPYDGKTYVELDGEAISILNALMTRLEMANPSPNAADTANNLALPLRIRIMNSDVMNAFALPGNTIVVTTAMLAEIEQLDELAAILAHERAHVRLRHTMQQLLRHTTFSYVLEVFGGGVSSATAQMLVTMGWTRDMEREADEIALMSMKQAGISPHGFTRFFRRLQATESMAAPKPTTAPKTESSTTNSDAATSLDDDVSEFDDITNKLAQLLITHPDSAARADAAEKIPPYPCTPLYGERTWKQTGLYVKKL